MSEMKRRIVYDFSGGDYDVRFEEYDPIAERQAQAQKIAQDVQDGIEEPSRSDVTYDAAYRAALIVLEELDKERDKNATSIS